MGMGVGGGGGIWAIFNPLTSVDQNESQIVILFYY